MPEIFLLLINLIINLTMHETNDCFCSLFPSLLYSCGSVTGVLGKHRTC